MMLFARAFLLFQRNWARAFSPAASVLFVSFVISVLFGVLRLGIEFDANYMFVCHSGADGRARETLRGGGASRCRCRKYA